MTSSFRGLGKLKLFFFLLILFAWFNPSSAQRKPGNEWIDNSKNYYKIQIASDGFYRVGYQELKNAGINPDTISSEHLQLFWRGTEVPMQVEDGGDGKINSGDYLLFFGHYNDGALDTVLYANPADITHTHYSMYTDTSSYYLTWGQSGKRIRRISFPGSISYQPINIIQKETGVFFKELYYDGIPVIPELNFSTPEYTEGEGWLSNQITKGGVRDIVISTPQYNSLSDLPEVEFRIFSKSDFANVNPDHDLIVMVGKDLNSLRTIYDTSFNGFVKIQKKLRILNSDLDTQIIVRVYAKGVSTSSSDVEAIAWVKVYYPKNLNFTNGFKQEEFNYQNNGTDTANYFQYSGLDASTSSSLSLYDISNGALSDASFNSSSNQTEFYLPNNGNANIDYIMFDRNNITTVNLKPVSFRKIDLTQNYNYLIITNNRFIKSANDFANYKSTGYIDSTTHFKPVVVTTSELYDEFFYGIHHPAALQNFCAYLYNNQSQKPKYLLLLGKGFEPEWTRRLLSEDLVPTMGRPASDLLITAGIDNHFAGRDTTLEPMISMGRISAKSEKQIYDYLDKLKVYDSLPPALWQKNITHISGGSDLQQQTNYRMKMQGLAEFISRPFVGAKVTGFYADKPDPVITDYRTAIQNTIQNGCGLFTYLAHGSLNRLGVEIGNLADLHNEGRYPFMYLNGCSVGNIGLPDSAMGESYVLSAKKGSIGWLSHSDVTVSYPLMSQLDKFYSNAGRTIYGATVGQIYRKVIADLKGTENNDRNFYSITLAWILQGDPSLRLYFKPKPDFAVTDSELFIVPEDAIATDDSIALAVPISNLGKYDYNAGNFPIEVKHKFPDGKIQIDTFYQTPIGYKDTAYFYYKTAAKHFQGTNEFDVFVNCDTSLDELSMTNNKAHLKVFIPGTGARALFPTDYAISAVDTPLLTAQSRNLFDNSSKFIFEIDTTPAFNSAAKSTSGLISGGNIVSWRPKLLSKDSTVYYWRVKLNLPADSGGEWDTRSFTLINGSPPGWSQSHFPQYFGSELENLSLDSQTRTFSFSKTIQYFDLHSNAFYSPGVGFINESAGASFQGSNAIYYKNLLMWEIDQNTLGMLTIDPRTGKPYQSCLKGRTPPAYPTCTPVPVSFQQFYMADPNERDSFVAAYNRVKPGNYILLVSKPNATDQVSNFKFKQWEPGVLDVFHKLGSYMPDSFTSDSVAFVLAAKKGVSQGKLFGQKYIYDKVVAVDPNGADMVDLRVGLIGTANPFGSITSKLIGPATKWKVAYQKFGTLDNPNYDKYYLQIIGRDKAGNDTLIADTVRTFSYDLSKVDAAKYPYIYLRAVIKDTARLTPPQLKLWQVLFDGAPEGTLVIDKNYMFKSGSINQGDSLHLRVKFTNISQFSFSPLKVRFSITNQGNTIVYDSTYQYGSLAAGNSMIIDQKIPSLRLEGTNRLSMVVNPDFDQPEVTLENNILKERFDVVGDRSNPVLDVTFDNRHILDYDIVSSHPRILVVATDENKQLSLNDTSYFNLYIKKDSDSGFYRINFSRPEVIFSKPDSNGKASISYTPTLFSGDYEFRADVRDVKGNQSATPFDIHFRVIEDPKVSRFYLYPNPVSSFTNSRFVFTLTGDDIPDFVSVSIFDLRGKLVAELGNEYFHGLHLGENEIPWNGKTASGKEIANGIYIYKAIVKKNGNDLPVYSLKKDSKAGDTFDKIIILRQ